MFLYASGRWLLAGDQGSADSRGRCSAVFCFFSDWKVLWSVGSILKYFSEHEALKVLLAVWRSILRRLYFPFVTCNVIFATAGNHLTFGNSYAMPIFFFLFQKSSLLLSFTSPQLPHRPFPYVHSWVVLSCAKNDELIIWTFTKACHSTAVSLQ